jgi:hypothetical protein
MNDNTTLAMQRYHQHFDVQAYNTVAELLASNLNADRDDSRVVDAMILLQNAAFGFCEHPDFTDAWHHLVVFCGRNWLSLHTVNAMRDFLRRFREDDTRIDDFESTAKAMLLGYRGLDEVKTAVAHANGVHGWRGRMAYELLAVADYLTQAAVQLLLHGSQSYIREKLQSGIRRLTGALYEGIRESDTPAMFNFKATYFPDEHDRR